VPVAMGAAVGAGVGCANRCMGRITRTQRIASHAGIKRRGNLAAASRAIFMCNLSLVHNDVECGHLAHRRPVTDLVRMCAYPDCSSPFGYGLRLVFEGM
jgi:hypothetical protein